MTISEAFAAVRACGAVILVDEQGPLLRGHVPAGVVAVLRAHRDRVEAILKLREVHRQMGLGDDDIVMIETALLDGRVAEIRIAVRGPAEAVA